MISNKLKKIKWSTDDIKSLKLLYRNQVPVNHISILLNRSVLSIMATAQRFKFAGGKKLVLNKDQIKTKNFYKKFSEKLKYNSKDFGDYTRKISYLSEQSAIIKLLSLDFSVYKPILDSSKADLIAIKNNKIIKFQVKTAGYSHRFNYFETQLSSRKHKIGKKDLRVRYSANDIDYFIIKISGLFKFYVIPIEDAIKEKSSNTRFFPNRKKVQHKTKANVFNTDKYFEAFDLIKS